MRLISYIEGSKIHAYPALYLPVAYGRFAPSIGARQVGAVRYATSVRPSDTARLLVMDFSHSMGSQYRSIRRAIRSGTARFRSGHMRRGKFAINRSARALIED